MAEVEVPLTLSSIKTKVVTEPVHESGEEPSEQVFFPSCGCIRKEWWNWKYFYVCFVPRYGLDKNYEMIRFYSKLKL